VDASPAAVMPSMHHIMPRLGFCVQQHLRASPLLVASCLRAWLTTSATPSSDGTSADGFTECLPSVEMAHRRLVREKAVPHRVPGAPLSAAQFSNEPLADDAARDDACT